ncbi:SCO family protein [Jeotgalibacillus proteolyticus]|uniref:Cytochrome c oxidase assembly protein n=1 Tax=Jeotgalibacillus proteolyticus TaxID=2082395 RepID=A0A2S5GGG0_9BACL|nr:SCO family protein [Jeotgalibacillus proteolyticus]PPA71953.1 cytochrome c oxidase assembly protein [Jeotgalibacillus proteolyticus]
MKKIYALITGAAVFLLAACSGGFEGNMEKEIQNFSYTNQQNETVDLNDIKGTPALVNFIFTNCDTVCPPMTFNMTEVQAELEAEGIEDYRIISFSVDPENDTPEALTEFMSSYELNEEKWDFLTGYSQEEIADFALNSFEAIVADDPNSDQVIHGTSFYLVNKEGTVVNSYNGISDVKVDEIVADVKAVSNE